MEGKKKLARPALGRGLSALISAAPVPILPSEPKRAALGAAFPKEANAPSMALIDGQDNVQRMPELRTTGSLAISTTSETTSDNFDRSGGERSFSAPPPGVGRLPTSARPPASPGDNDEEGVQYLPTNCITNNPKQPRQEFSEQELRELADSVKTLGVLQPVLVRRSSTKGVFEIVAGERRWRACKLAGLTIVPVLIRNLTDRETLEIALVENIQRANLNPIEEATAYQRLADEFGLSQQSIAERVGKDRASVANYMRLLKLSEPVLKLVREGKLSIGHAKAILTVREPSAQNSLARKVVDEGLSVRQLEAIVSRSVVLENGKTRDGRPAGKLGSEVNTTTDVVDRLRRVLGTKVMISHHRSGRGKIVVEYFSEQELGRIVDQICNQSSSS